MWEKIKKVFSTVVKWSARITMVGGAGAVLVFLGAQNVFVGGSGMGTLAEQIHDPTWQALVKLLLFGLGVWLFFNLLELYLLVCLAIGIATGNRIWYLFADAIGEKGILRGILTGFWRSIPVWLDPFLGVFVKQWFVKRARAAKPASSSVFRFFHKDYWAPDHNPYPEDYAAAKRPIKGKTRPKKADLREYEGRNLPLFIERYEPGRRYVVDYSVERHKATTDHWDFTFRDPHTGMIQRWAIRKRMYPHYKWEDGRWKPVRVGAFKSDGKHGHVEMFNPPFKAEGYGAGTTTVVEHGKATVWVSQEGRLHMHTDSGHAFVFLKGQRWPEKDEWLLVPMRDSPVGGIPRSYAPRTTEFKSERNPDNISELWEKHNIAYATVKGDGSYREMTRDNYRVSLVGRRAKTEGGKPVLNPDGSPQGIDVADKIPGVRDLPKEVFPPGSKAEVEVYARDRTANKHGGNHFKVVSSRLNMKHGAAAEAAAEDGELIVKMWRIHKNGDKTYTSATEMAAALDEMKESSNGTIHTFPRRTTPEGAEKLFRDEVARGGEGIVLVPEDLSKPMIRIKAVEEVTGTIVGVEPVKSGVDGSKYFVDGKPVAVGAYRYQTDDGSIGRVSGLSDTEKFDAWEHPENYVGKKIDVVGHRVTSNGVMRKPHGYRIKED